MNESCVRRVADGEGEEDSCPTGIPVSTRSEPSPHRVIDEKKSQGSILYPSSRRAENGRCIRIASRIFSSIILSQPRYYNP